MICVFRGYKILLNFNGSVNRIVSSRFLKKQKTKKKHTKKNKTKKKRRKLNNLSNESMNQFM